MREELEWSGLEWTATARERWDRFLNARVKADCLGEEGGTDLREDLTLHFLEELAGEGSRTVTHSRVDLAIARLGGMPETDSKEDFASYPKKSRALAHGALSAFTVLFGVVFPLGVFGLELLTGFCGSVFFDPLGTWWHVLLVAFVVASNWWLMSKCSREVEPRWRALSAGASLGISAFYALLFVPLVPISFMALLAFGMGLISLTPVLNFIATRRITRRQIGWGTAEWKTWWKRGLFGAIAMILILEVPSLWTRVALERSLSQKESVSQSGVSQLRLWHSEKTLLRACYEGNRGTTMSTDISGWLMDGWQLMLPFLWQEPFRDFDSGEVRSVFYRVTGKQFNAVPPPEFVAKASFMGAGRGDWSEFQWDEHLGGEEVAVRISGLDLVDSRMDGHLDGNSALAYQEWTLVFRNKNRNAQEARMQMLLPEEGVVSRVTLWVNGEPREAAFASKSEVRAAYQSVAVVQQRDPVLVTASGPGRVLVQCFPVPPNGGEIKIRIGMTAPLHQGKVAMPMLLERNFGIEPDLETAVWVQAPDPFSYQGKTASHRDGPGQSLQLRLTPDSFLKEGAFLTTAKSPAPVVWCRDPFALQGEEQLTRQWVEEQEPALKQCIVVVDGSVSVGPFAEKLTALLESLGEGVTTVIADDGVNLDGLAKYRFRGGRDNGPALEWALRKAREAEESAVVWLHGPQPMSSASEESLAQLLERGWEEVPLYSVALRPGGNRLLEKLHRFRCVQTGPRLSGGLDDLQSWLTQLVKGGPRTTAEWSREAINSNPENIAGVKVWDQLARYWAAEKVRTGSRQQTADRDSIAFAAEYQLVTAYSGAVVLETAQQFEDHGLEPVDPSTTPKVPSTPEPGTWLLLLIGGTMAATRRRRSGS
ncbi:VIT domain-containing protein [Roseibacillus persicicus]|uniref:VIT domain-containing protein n=1 Tax=Roseibacillus persicicus TaxID=454148 RepID=UPI00398B6D12